MPKLEIETYIYLPYGLKIERSKVRAVPGGSPVPATDWPLRRRNAALRRIRRRKEEWPGAGEGVAEERVFVPEECLRSLAERRSGRLTLSPEATAPGLLGPDAQAPGPSVRLASAAAPAGTVLI
eukprot:tig00000383_g24715.t1